MGELEKSMYYAMYEHFKINSILFRELQVGMTLDENNKEVLFMTEVFDSVIHNAVPRTFTVPITPENKIAANALKGLIAIEKSILSRIPTNVTTLDKFGTYDRNNVAAKQIDILVGFDFKEFTDSLLESLGLITKSLMAKGTLDNIFAMRISATDKVNASLKHDDRYIRNLTYQGLNLQIKPEMFQLQIGTFITNLLLKIEFIPVLTGIPISVIQVPVKLSVHNKIEKVAGMNTVVNGIINSGLTYDSNIKTITDYYYDTVNRYTDYSVTPCLESDNKLFSEIFRDPNLGVTEGKITVKCVNSTLENGEGAFSMANIYNEDDSVKEDCSSAIYTSPMRRVDSGLEYDIIIDATKIASTDIASAKLVIDTGYMTDKGVFRDSLAIVANINLSEYVTPEEPTPHTTRKVKK